MSDEITERGVAPSHQTDHPPLTSNPAADPPILPLDVEQYPPTAAERTKNNSKGFKDVYLKAQVRTGP